MTDRQRQILSMLVQMDKQFGKGSVLMLGSRAALPVEVITDWVYRNRQCARRRRIPTRSCH